MNINKSSRQWLNPAYNKLFWRQELTLEDLPIENLDSAALWDQSAGHGKITNKNSKTNNRLRQALMVHHHWINQSHPSGKLIKTKRIFTDVIVCLPPNVYYKAIIESQQTHLNSLLHNLAEHHKEDFRCSLPENRGPRYLARPDPHLENNNIAFIFGPTIYIPDSGEPAFQMVLSLNGSNKTLLPSFECWYDGKRQNIPTGFYVGQELLLLVPENGESLISIPGWQDQNTYLLLRRIGENWDAFLWNSSRYFQYLPKRTSAKIWYFTIPLNDQKNLTLEIAPQQETAAQHNISSTIIPDLPDPISPSTLELETVGLPALFNGLKEWTLWLDPRGGLASLSAIMAKQHNPLACLSLNQSGLSFTNVDGASTFLGNRINKQQEITLSATKLTLMPSPECLFSFVGLLSLSATNSYPVSENFTIIGRFDPDNIDNLPEISLDQLDQPGSIAGQEITLNNIGLSRHHAQVRVIGECLEAKLKSLNNRLFRLDKNRQLCEMRHNSAEPLTLNLGDYLVVGNFLLRFKKIDS